MSKNRFATKIHVKKGDRVKVISGAYRGVEGNILEVHPDKYKVVVEGVNLKKKHTKPNNDQAGGIVEINAPIHASNVALIDPKTKQATRIGRKKVDGVTVRYSKKSGEIIK
jgi:large subunit ribosomal protein L24